MARLGLRATDVSVALVGDGEMRALNRKYRGKDKPTDVLSFDQGLALGGRTLLGDVVISVPTTRRQARAHGKTQRRELLLLSIHGLLHLMGYDHATRTEEERMFSLQNRLVEHAHAEL